mgnify:CR=1 FL=1
MIRRQKWNKTKQKKEQQLENEVIKRKNATGIFSLVIILSDSFKLQRSRCFCIISVRKIPYTIISGVNCGQSFPLVLFPIVCDEWNCFCKVLVTICCWFYFRLHLPIHTGGDKGQSQNIFDIRQHIFYLRRNVRALSRIYARIVCQTVE